MRPKRRYSRRGEFGNPTPVCEWCGARVYQGSSCSGNRDSGTWCSTECSAAGQVFQNAGCAVIGSVVVLFLISLMLNPNVIVRSYIGTDPTITGWVFVGIFSLVPIYGAYLVRLGIRVRTGSGSIEENRVLQTYGDFSSLHQEILEFVKTYPANNGVPVRTVTIHFREKGILLSHIYLAIEELVSSQFLNKTKRGRLTPAEST